MTIAFAVCTDSMDRYRRLAMPGLRLCAEEGSRVLKSTDHDSIFSAYNEILDAVVHWDHLEALVLLHDDVELRDPDFCRKVRQCLSDPSVAIVGAIGARDVRSLKWWEGKGCGRVSETGALIDFGARTEDVDAVDGLLLVLSPWAVRNLRFDEATFCGFHGYDIDLCFQARAAGKRVLVTDIELFHHTKGGYGDVATFERADSAWRRKWLPGPGEQGAG